VPKKNRNDGEVNGKNSSEKKKKRLTDQRVRKKGEMTDMARREDPMGGKEKPLVCKGESKKCLGSPKE